MLDIESASRLRQQFDGTMSICDAAARLFFRQALPCRRALSTTQRPASEGVMPKYLLVARDSGDWTQTANGASPAEMQAILDKYNAWAERVAAQGKLQGGQKLFDGQGKVLRGQATALKVSDGPFIEGKEVIGGFW